MSPIHLTQLNCNHILQYYSCYCCLFGLPYQSESESKETKKMSSISQKACCMAAVVAIQGFRNFTGPRAFHFKNLVTIPNLLPTCSNSFGFASATGSSAATVAKTGTTVSQMNVNRRVQEASTKSKDESLRRVMFLSCWSPN